MKMKENKPVPSRAAGSILVLVLAKQPENWQMELHEDFI